MNALREAEDALSKLTRAEKAQVLQWVVRDLGDAFPGIESISGVSGGEPCIIDRTIYHGASPEGTAIRFESFTLWA